MLVCVSNYITDSSMDKFCIQDAGFRCKIMLFHAKICMVQNKMQTSPLDIFDPTEIQNIFLIKYM